MNAGDTKLVVAHTVSGEEALAKIEPFSLAVAQPRV
jgi:hypothetical protein